MVILLDILIAEENIQLICMDLLVP
jgi:hypothetical protein